MYLTLHLDQSKLKKGNNTIKPVTIKKKKKINDPHGELYCGQMLIL